MRVPMLDLKTQYSKITNEIDSAVKDVLSSQQFILGPEVRELERELAAYTDSTNAVGCASGSDALLLALMALGIGEGDEVITSPFSFFATAGSIARLGAHPVFVDIDAGTFNIDAGLIERAVGPRTKVIMPVHLFGQCAEMGPLNEIAEARGLAVIEDAAQAIGAEWRGRRAGNLGAVAAFSFYPSKNLGGAGDGGLLTTNDAGLADRLRRFRAHGAKNKYYHDLVGINSRLDSLQAAILRVKLRYLDEWTAARRANAERYRKLFAAFGLIQSGNVSLPEERASCFHVYNQFVVRVKDRDRLQAHMAENKVGTEIYYPLPLHLQPCFKDLGYEKGSMPVAEAAAAEVLAIPIYPELGEDAQRYVVDVIRDFYR
jgi:dTDP-4-amino-4,6-dideoxygalactose transaminase